MCGIAGLLLNDAGARPEPARVRAMVEGARASRTGRRRVSTERLHRHAAAAIVDPIGGHQPVTNGTAPSRHPTRVLQLPQLRAELASAGHPSEPYRHRVIVHGYEAWGIDGLARA